MKDTPYFFPGTQYDSYLANAWTKAFKALNPSSEEVQHGFKLHEECRPIENYGFLPRIWTHETVEYMNGLVDEGVGMKVWSRKSTAFRCLAASRDQKGREEFVLAMRASGLKGMVVALSGADTIEETVNSYATHQQLFRTFFRDIVNVGDVEELNDANTAGKIGCILSVAGPPALGEMNDPDEKLEWVDVWHQLGIRLMHLSYNRRNVIADGCTESNDSGVSDFGVEFIRRMNRAGIIVDVPHSSKNTLLQACAISEKPVMASHVGCKSLFDHVRCKSDEELKSIAQTGGLAGIYAVPSLLGTNADINLMLAHIAHAVKIIGAEHVAIGTDLNHQTPWPEEIRAYPSKADLTQRAGGWKPEHAAHYNDEHIGGSLSWTNWPLFTVGLVKLGLKDEQIAQILGGNFSRILAETASR